MSYGVSYDANPVFILGKFNAAEIVLTGMDVIGVTCSGFRVLDNGPYKVATVPKLQELLHHEDITLAIFDRQTGKQVLTVIGVRPTGYNTSISAKALQDLTVNFMGLALSDEDGDQDEEASATQW